MTRERAFWIGLAVAVVAIALLAALFMEHGAAPPPPIEYSEAALRLMSIGAQKRDPIACGQGLTYFEHHHDDLRRDPFIKWCCHPPVDDMAGIVPAACGRMLRRRLAHDGAAMSAAQIKRGADGFFLLARSASRTARHDRGATSRRRSRYGDAAAFPSAHTEAGDRALIAFFDGTWIDLVEFPVEARWPTVEETR